MTSISYEKIFSSFLSNIVDYDLVEISPSDSYQIMTEYLHKAISTPYVRRIFSTVNLQDEILILSYELNRSDYEDTDEDFVIHLLGCVMSYQWAKPQVARLENIQQYIGSSNDRLYAQANHLSAIRNLRDDMYNEYRFMLTERGSYNNSYLDGDISNIRE